MKSWIATIMCTAMLAGIAQAEPFAVTDVSRDAEWVVHVDVDGLKGSRIGDVLMEEMNRKESAAKLDAVQAIFNFDPREDLSGVTLYGADNRPQTATAVLRGHFDSERLVTLVRANPAYENGRSGRHEIHSWIDENNEDANRVYAGFEGARTLVLSESESRVVAALDVLDGDGDSLDPSSELASTIQGTRASLFIAAANMAEMPEIAPEAAMLKKARAFQLALGAPGDDLEGALRLSTDTVRSAQQVEQILRGMVAFAALNDLDQPELAAMAQTVEINRDGSRVECILRHPLDEIIVFLRNEAERKRDAKEL